MNKNIFLTTAILFFLLDALPAQQYKPVDAGSSVKFLIKNFGLNVDGSFRGLDGSIVFNPDKLETAVFKVTVDAATVNTGNSKRDGHLKKEEYFDAANYPKIRFTSSKISSTGKASQYLVDGTVTIKGVSKPVSFPFSTSTSAGRIIFTGQFKLNRRDFKVGGKSLVMSDEVTVVLNIAATKQ
jgi:polyisoprenoid-binding protein YceI